MREAGVTEDLLSGARVSCGYARAAWPMNDAPPPRASTRARATAWERSASQPCMKFGRGDILVRNGAHFDGLHVIRTGSCKEVVPSFDGEEHIAAFRLPGEVLGLEAIASGIHGTTALALEPTTCWRVPPERVRGLLGEESAFAQALVHALSQAIGRGMRDKLLLGTMTADQRVASFLLDLADRYHALGYSGSEFELRMTRVEIGTHLGISTETVSRSLSRFCADGLIAVRRRSVALRDRAALARILVHRD